MPQIHILEQHVADLIAAGEVVERPAAAVKELLENAVDAGAKTVVVEIRGGGRGLIRITDDGCGMAPEDAGVCFLRHATSKLRDSRGLEAIGTLGFRGEALAAIASVSRITLTTRPKDAPLGVRLEVTAGEIDSMEETGCTAGTTIQVRDLFYNTPARLKFLGTDRAEGAACVQAALRCAMGHPEVSFRCLRDGQEEFFSPGDGKMDSCVYALLGRDFAKGLLSVDTESDGVAVKGFVSAPGYCRGNRSAQHFYVNGRPIRSRTMQAALEQAYQNTAMVGKFPGCVLYLTLPNGLVDVNVHPTKAEVKFAKEKAVFDGVYYGTLAALGKKESPAEAAVQTHIPLNRPIHAAVPPRPAAPAAPKPREDFFRRMDTTEFKKSVSSFDKPARPAEPVRPMARDSGVSYKAEWKIPTATPAAKPAPLPKAAEEETSIPAPAPVEERVLPAEPEVTVLAEEFKEEPFRIIGEALNLYILVEQGDKLIVIDKHAAHERLLFDKARLNEAPLPAQELLLSETLNTDPEAAALLTEKAELMEHLGFGLEAFGEAAFVVRAVPADIDPATAVPLLEELIEKLREGRSLSMADIKERLAETVACKAAVKAGMTSQPEEMMALARRVLAGDVTHCPHGRPVMTVFTRTELDKRFSRIV